MSITQEEAHAVVGAAVVKAQELGVRMAISVVDDHGELVASSRMDGMKFGFAMDLSRGKAMATVLWGGRPSGDLAERAALPVFQGVKELYNGKVIYAQGAVPIKKGDEVIGAVGCGGAAPAQDEECAVAGAAAVS